MTNLVDAFCSGEVYERARDKAAQELGVRFHDDMEFGVMADIVLKAFFDEIWNDAREQDERTY